MAFELGVMHAGDAAVEAGDAAVEAGDATFDAGDAIVDAGDTVVDAGEVIVDAGDAVPQLLEPLLDDRRQLVNFHESEVTSVKVASQNLYSDVGVPEAREDHTPRSSSIGWMT